MGNESAAGLPVKDGKGLWLFEHDDDLLQGPLPRIRPSTSSEGYANRPLAFQIAEAPVEFRTLRFGERKLLGRRPETAPELLQEVESIFGCQRCDLQPTRAQERRIPKMSKERPPGI